MHCNIRNSERQDTLPFFAFYKRLLTKVDFL